MLNNNQIPDVVNEKWEKTIEIIRSDKILQNDKKRNFILLKTAVSIAACFVLVTTISAFNPVFAEKIPFMDNILSILKITHQTNNAFALKTPVEDYATVIEPAETSLDIAEVVDKFEIKESYCDGNILVVSAVMPLFSDEEINTIYPSFELEIDGETLQLDEDYYSRMVKVDEYFIGAFNFNVSEFAYNKSSFDFEIKVSEIEYNNGDKLYVDFENMPCSEENLNEFLESLTIRERNNEIHYKEAEKEIFAPENMTFSANLPVDRDNNMFYEMDFSSGNCEVKSVVTSPISTKIEYSAPENTILFVSDNLGNTLDRIIPQNDNTIFTPLVDGTTELSFDFYHIDDSKNKVASFKLNTNGESYISQEDFDKKTYSTLFRKEKVTIIPDVSAYFPEEYENRFEDDIILNLGETMTLNSENFSYIQDGKLNVTISNMQIFDSLTDANVKLENTVLTDKETEIGKKFVTFDIKIEALNAKGIAYSGVGENTFCIENIVNFGHRYIVQDSENPPSLNYFSCHNDTLKGYLMFNTEENQTQTFTIGSFVSEKDLQNGNFQINTALESDYENGDYFANDYYIYNIPAIK